MTTTVRTACTYDCPDACGLHVAVEGERVTAIAGDPAHPITAGFVCTRIRRHVARLQHPERLRQPLLRVAAGSGPEAFRAVAWDEALALAAARLEAVLREHGAPAVVLLRGGGSLGLSKELVGHFFHSLGPVTTLRGGACGEAGEEAQLLDFGAAACHDYSDLAHSGAVVLWGKDPAASGPHLLPFLAAARRRGAPVVAVHPLPVASARLADRVISVAPGGDGFLALATLRLLHERGALAAEALARVENRAAFERLLLAPEHSVTTCAERAGVTGEEVAALAALYVERRPVATWIGWGLQRWRSGGRNVRCIDALALLTGNVGCAGGGANFTSWRRRGLASELLAPAGGRTIAAPMLGRDLAALTDPPARFVWIAGANPVTQLADSGAVAGALRGAGFVVVVDAFLTDTARAADLVLPVALMLEEDDVVGSYQHHHVAVVRRCVPPPAGARGDLEILRALATRLGRSVDPLLADPAAALARLTAPWFDEPLPLAAPRRNPMQPKVPFAERCATPSGLARLLASPPELPATEPGFPLLLLTPASRRWQTSQRFAAEQRGRPLCRAHPAAAVGLADGEPARLVSPLGALQVTLRLDVRLRLGLCVVERGGWVAHGHGVNAIVAARATDLGEGTAFYDQRVRLEPG